MIVTVTNLTTNILNAFDTYLGYPGVPGIPSAVGGSRKYPVPFPFDWLVFQVNPTSGYQYSFSMHERDFAHKRVPWLPHEPGEEWNTLIQAGTVSFSTASEATAQDAEDIFIHSV